MDMVHEENRQRELMMKKVGFKKCNHQNEEISEIDEHDEDDADDHSNMLMSQERRDSHFLHSPQLMLTDSEGINGNLLDCNAGDSRRPSAIIAALRRPSQAVALSAAHAVMNQRRYLLGMFDDNSNQNLRCKDDEKLKSDKLSKRFKRGINKNGFSLVLSALYAKLLVVLGVAFPITEVISDQVHPYYYQGFYLYLYLGSIIFITYEYVSFVKEKAVKDLIKNFRDEEKGEFLTKLEPNNHNNNRKPAQKYGSFFLRLGAIAFGIGSMVYSGLEFGKYFELKNSPECYSTSLQAITPATRMILTLLQVQFIFLNPKDVELHRHKLIARFGLMHLIATNLCEWLCVLIEETKHEIIHLSLHRGINSSNIKKYCPEGRLMGSLVTNASPFLFPCTIEYSLICAVILFEMWKHIRSNEEEENEKSKRKNNKYKNDDFAANTNSGHHFTIDCSNSHKGLFAGILVIVLTIISLVMFFVLTNKEKENSTDADGNYAEFEVNMLELLLYITTTIVVLIAMFQLRNLKYEKNEEMGLDGTLLTVAQIGMFIYCMFSIIGWYFTLEDTTPVGLVADVFSFVQTCLQTMFVLDAWWRRCKNLTQAKRKPGRELIIFLMISNMAMWSINTLEKNRAEFRPTHLKFFGDWAWTIITHISMPLAIFYRFHSTICLFEIWKTVYKIKSSFKNPLFPVM